MTKNAAKEGFGVLLQKAEDIEAPCAIYRPQSAGYGWVLMQVDAIAELGDGEYEFSVDGYEHTLIFHHDSWLLIQVKA